MDEFNKLYNTLMEQLDSTVLAPTHGSTGGALETSDTYATGNMQRPYGIGQYTRKGKIKTSKSRKRK